MNSQFRSTNVLEPGIYSLIPYQPIYVYTGPQVCQQWAIVIGPSMKGLYGISCFVHGFLGCCNQDAHLILFYIDLGVDGDLDLCLGYMSSFCI